MDLKWAVHWKTPFSRIAFSARFWVSVRLTGAFCMRSAKWKWGSSVFLCSEVGTLPSWSSCLLTRAHLLHARRPLSTAPEARSWPAGSASPVSPPCQVALNPPSTSASPTGCPIRGAGLWETVRDQCRCQYLLNSILPHCFWFSFVHESLTLCIFPSILPTLWTSVTRETSATHILCN